MHCFEKEKLTIFVLKARVLTWEQTKQKNVELLALEKIDAFRSVGKTEDGCRI